MCNDPREEVTHETAHNDLENNEINTKNGDKYSKPPRELKKAIVQQSHEY